MSGQLAEMTRVVEFRSDLYDCCTTWSDALFEICDAVLSSPSPVASVPSLSLEPVFRRGHGSLAEGIRAGVRFGAPSRPRGLRRPSRRQPCRDPDL